MSRTGNGAAGGDATETPKMVCAGVSSSGKEAGHALLQPRTHRSRDFGSNSTLNRLPLTASQLSECSLSARGRPAGTASVTSVYTVDNGFCLMFLKTTKRKASAETSDGLCAHRAPEGVIHVRMQPGKAAKGGPGARNSPYDIDGILIAPSADAAIACAATSLGNTFALVITPERMSAKFPSNVPEIIRTFVAGKRCPLISASRSHNLHRLALEISHCSYVGAARNVHLRGKALELLAEVLRLGETPQKAIAAQTTHRLVTQAQDMLMENLVHPPTVKELSERLCTTPRRLSAAFRAIHKKTIAVCLVEWRLAEGYELLLETDITVKEVAVHLGYTHSNHFINAFTSRFGISPAACRRIEHGDQ